MRRIIKDYNKLDPYHKGLLLQRFPDGVSNSDLTSFTDHTGKKVRALEIETPDAIMLIRFKPSVSDRHFEADENISVQEFDDDREGDEPMKSSFL